MKRSQQKRWVRAGAVAVGSLPLLGLAVGWQRNGLGANPVEAITHTTGEWALRFLILCLAVTPARRWLGWSWLAPERRTFGLFAFAYASAHFATYLALDLGFEFGLLFEDIVERPYITVGFTSLMLMLPLAITSTRGWMKKLGARWVSLHKLVYVAAGAALLHYLWLVKADLLPPIVHATIVAALLALRFRPTRVSSSSDTP